MNFVSMQHLFLSVILMFVVMGQGPQNNSHTVLAVVCYHLEAAWAEVRDHQAWVVDVLCHGIHEENTVWGLQYKMRGCT